MESPVVLDKPPEYHGNGDRGFPFDEEEGSAWGELAARHPDIAARLRPRAAAAHWPRKRRPSSHDHTDDFGDSFSGFPFDDIPAEFREHLPARWRHDSQPESQPHASQPHASPQHVPQQNVPQPHVPQQQTTATQTECDPTHEPSLPQYGLRNTVDLGRSADPSVDANERSQRSTSAPPNSGMSSERAEAPPSEHSNVRHIPIFVEGRDEPVINKSVDHGTHFGESKPHPPPPHVDRDAYFADETPTFHQPANFGRAFGSPFNKGFRGPQPFTQQKAYPQSAFARAASPQRAQTPPHDEHYVKVPVQHERPRSQQQQHPQQPAAKQQQPPPKQQQPPPKQPTPPPAPARDPTPPPKQPVSNDPITQILSIQTDVLNLMTEVENFAGTKKDKRYLYLDEMLTRNLIKLDNIETEGKENIRQARKEAIKCIQKCIAVLEAKAESNAANAARAQPADVPMQESEAVASETQPEASQNGEVEMKEATKVEETQPERIDETQDNKQETQSDPTPEQVAADTRPEGTAEKPVDKPSPKKKVVKKRDKSKEGKSENSTETSKDSNKPEVEKAEDKTVDKAVEKEKVEEMQVDKEEKSMEVDGAASQ